MAALPDGKVIRGSVIGYGGAFNMGKHHADQIRAAGMAVTFLDVGQGLSVVIRLPSGRAVLYDAGPAFAGGAVVAPFLKSAGVGRLAAAVLSHTDSDHAGGMAVVMQHVPADTILFTGHGIRNNARFAELRGVPRRNSSMAFRLAYRGVELAGEPGVRLVFLHPPRGWFRRTSKASAADENSAVLAIEYGNTAALLTGDLETRGERMLSDHLGGLPSIRLLQVPHHGSQSSSSPGFLAALDPGYAVVSAGRGNRFGHPRPVVVARYRRAGVRFLETALDGAVIAVSDGRDWSIQPPPGKSK